MGLFIVPCCALPSSPLNSGHSREPRCAAPAGDLMLRGRSRGVRLGGWTWVAEVIFPHGESLSRTAALPAGDLLRIVGFDASWEETTAPPGPRYLRIGRERRKLEDDLPGATLCCCSCGLVAVPVRPGSTSREVGHPGDHSLCLAPRCSGPQLRDSPIGGHGAILVWRSPRCPSAPGTRDRASISPEGASCLVPSMRWAPGRWLLSA